MLLYGPVYYTKLKTIHYQQKHYRIIFSEDILSHLRRLLRLLNALNVYQIILNQHLNFMYTFNNKTPEYSMISLKNLSINILPSSQNPIALWKSSLCTTTNYFKIFDFLPRTKNLEWLSNKGRKRNAILLIISIKN